jgi:short-subunit dehydrogenase
MERHGPREILITGASSGIGAALARAYAAEGVTLHLGGRDRDRLEAVAADCRARGSRAVTRCQDVAEARGMAAWITEACAGGALDLVIANAGISGEAKAASGTPDGRPGEAHALAGKILAVNVAGVVNTVYPALEAMLKMPAPATGRRGQIAIMSSLAGFRGMPTAPAYCASKAALRSLGEGLRPAMARHGIGVSVICPGFVESPMTEGNPFPMPFLMPADRAAAIIKRGLARNRARIAFPLRLAAAAWLFGILPPAWTDPLVRRAPGRPH